MPPHDNKPRNSDERQIYKSGLTTANTLTYLARTGIRISDLERVQEQHLTLIQLEEFARRTRDSYVKNSRAWHEYDCTVQGMEVLRMTAAREIAHFEIRLKTSLIQQLHNTLSYRLHHLEKNPPETH